MTFAAVAIGGSAIIGGVVANNNSKRQAAAMKDAGGGTPQWLQNQQHLFADKSNEAYNQQFTPYGGQRVANLNSTQLSAYDPSRYSRIQNGGALTNAGSGALMDMLGPYKENPYMQGMIDKAQGDMSASLGKAGLGSGSFGNAGVARQGAEGMANASLGMRFQDYNNYADRRLQATQGAAAYDQNRFNNDLTTADRQQAMQQQQGNLQYGIDQSNLDNGYQDYVTGRDWNLRQLGILGNGSQVQSRDGFAGPQPDRMGNTLGGAMIGGQLANAGMNYFNRPGQQPNFNTGITGTAQPWGGDFGNNYGMSSGGF